MVIDGNLQLVVYRACGERNSGLPKKNTASSVGERGSGQGVDNE